MARAIDMGRIMFCPKCKAEYRKGFTVCGDCGLPLVDALAPSPEPEFVDYVEILATYNLADMAFMKSLLDGESIQYVFKGEHFLYARPLADPVRLMVRSDQVSDVLELIKDLKLSFLGIRLDQ